MRRTLLAGVLVAGMLAGCASDPPTPASTTAEAALQQATEDLKRVTQDLANAEANYIVARAERDACAAAYQHSTAAGVAASLAIEALVEAIGTSSNGQFQNELIVTAGEQMKIATDEANEGRELGCE